MYPNKLTALYLFRLCKNITLPLHVLLTSNLLNTIVSKPTLVGQIASFIQGTRGKHLLRFRNICYVFLCFFRRSGGWSGYCCQPGWSERRETAATKVPVTFTSPFWSAACTLPAMRASPFSSYF